MSFVDKKKMIKKILPLFLMVIAVVAVSVTGATVLHTLTLENPIKTPTVEGEIGEETSNGAKDVWFINNGEADVFLRVSYTESWVYKNEDTEEKEILPNKAAVLKTDGTTEEVSIADPQWSTAWANDWTEMDDGWYYYNSILAGSSSGYSATYGSTDKVVEGVEFLTSLTDDELEAEGISEILDDRYKDAKYQFHFVLEVVQASDEWNVSYNAVKEVFEKEISNDDSWSGTADWTCNTKYDCVIKWSN